MQNESNTADQSFNELLSETFGEEFARTSSKTGLDNAKRHLANARTPEEIQWAEKQIALYAPKSQGQAPTLLLIAAAVAAYAQALLAALGK